MSFQRQDTRYKVIVFDNVHDCGKVFELDPGWASEAAEP